MFSIDEPWDFVCLETTGEGGKECWCRGGEEDYDCGKSTSGLEGHCGVRFPYRKEEKTA